MSLGAWVELVHLGMWRNRMEPDYIANAGDYQAEFFDTLKKMVKSGAFWGD